MQSKFQPLRSVGYNIAMKWTSLLLSPCVLLLAMIASAQEPERDALPTILLTGFEPFGAGRPPNPSWEGIKALDGKEWRGHRLVARQLPVVWGAPQKDLEPLLKELKPVAVFSFGQGGGYAIETVADNRRAKARDNNNAEPTEREIFPDAPEKFTATIDAQRLVAALKARDYNVAISREAGNYLCEECLYTLEYFKQRDKLAATVLFCHVPPLKDGHYEPADVERFVLAMLDAWREVYPR